MGTLTKAKYCAHGYAAYFILSTMDSIYKPNMTVDECK